MFISLIAQSSKVNGDLLMIAQTLRLGHTWLRRWDSNPRYRGYEPRDLAAGLPRNNDGGTSPIYL